jgi:Outer membrane protein beta-barrel domain
MKKPILVLSLVLMANIAKSQVIISLLFGDKLNSDKVFFGLILGGSASNLSGYSTSSPFYNFNLGLFLNLKMSSRFFLQFDAMAKYKLGAKGLPVYSLNDEALDSLFKQGQLERNIKYLSVATTAQYRFYDYFLVEAGPQISLRTKATDIFSAGRAGGDLTFEKDISDMATRFDLGAVTGIAYQFEKGQGIKIGIRYYFGFIDIFPSDAGNNANRSFQVNAYIPIGRYKALAKQNKPKTEN